MVLQDHILFTTWLGSWAKKVKRQGYDAITLPNLLLARRRRHAWAVAAGLERSESVAKRVCLALKSYDAAKAERRGPAKRELDGSQSRASQKHTTVAASKENSHQLEGDGDKSRASEQPSCAGSDGNAHESEADSPFKDVLSKVTFTESPSFAAWVPCDTSDIEHIKLSNVSFRDCEQSGLTLMSTCELENVAFINCKFDRATFLDVKLSNVTFSHVTFADTTFYRLWLKNATIINVDFRKDVWRASLLKNALIGKDCFARNSDTIRQYGVRGSSRSSKSIRRCLDSPLSLDDLQNKVGRDTVWDRDIRLLESRDPKGQLLTLLAKHPTIISRIMSDCFPGTSVHIHEYPKGVKIPGESPTSKKLYSAKFSTGSRMSSNRTTYFGTLQAETPVRIHPPTNAHQRGVGNCTGLLLIDKKFSALALKHLYGRSLLLKCSAEGAREFLIAHKDNMKLVKQLVLHFCWPEDGSYFAPNMHGWRYLLGTIRHQFSFIPNIHLRIGPAFWKRNDWPLGVDHVLADVENCPLADAHKFAAPADRWRFKDDQSTHRTDGTLLFIRVEGARSPEERKFIDELVDEIKERRTDRPLFVRSPEGKEITYRCADQLWETRRS
jgi:hypothetical protein